MEDFAGCGALLQTCKEHHQLCARLVPWYIHHRHHTTRLNRGVKEIRTECANTERNGSARKGRTHNRILRCQERLRVLRALGADVRQRSHSQHERRWQLHAPYCEVLLHRKRGPSWNIQCVTWSRTRAVQTCNQEPPDYSSCT